MQPYLYFLFSQEKQLSTTETIKYEINMCINLSFSIFVIFLLHSSSCKGQNPLLTHERISYFSADRKLKINSYHLEGVYKKGFVTFKLGFVSRRTKEKFIF